MSTQKQKFRNLYYVIKNDNVIELDNYFKEYPNQDLDQLLTIGKKNTLLAHALDSSSFNSIRYLIDLLNLNQMKKYVYEITRLSKYGSNILRRFYTRAHMLSQAIGKNQIITDIILRLIQQHQTLEEGLFDDIIGLPNYDFENLIRNNIDNTRKRLEYTLIECKTTWVKYFFEYYISKNIDIRQLAIKLLLYNNSDSKNTILKIIKKYLSLTDTTKFKIEYSKYNTYESEYEYTLQFIVFITCNTKGTELNDFTMFRDKTFEEQFNNYISEKTNFHEYTKNLLTNVAKVNNGTSEYHTELFYDSEIYVIQQILPYLSDNFFTKLKELNQIQINKYRNFFNQISLNINNKFTCIDELYKQYLVLK